MTFTKTTEYALRVLTFMADDPSLMYSSDYLFKQTDIPKKYLQRLLTDLSKNNLLVSIRGKQGGYRFAKNIKKVSLADIIEAVEGFQKEPVCFFGFGDCIRTEPCAMHDVWVSIQEKLIKTLSTTKLSDLIVKK
jgi:Rrf2 family transcriptional regulator, iron-sulfur cluster assembly transcription factor